MKKTLLILISLAIIGGLAFFVIKDREEQNQPQGQEVDARAQSHCSVKTLNAILGVGRSPYVNSNFLKTGYCRTLYVFEGDGQNLSNCTAACSETWPPYLQHNEVSDDLSREVTTLVRADGRVQYAISGKPLYFHVDDKKPEDVKGLNVPRWGVVRTTEELLPQFQL